MDSKKIEQYNNTFVRLVEDAESGHHGYSLQRKGENISLYAGLTDGNYSLAVASNDIDIELKDTSIITIKKHTFKDRFAFIFSLTDRNLLSIFISFIVDLDSILEEDESITFKQVYNRYLYWLKMFKSVKQDISEMVIMGLINELYFLSDTLIPTYGIDPSLTSWIGPSMTHKDFAFESGVWFETKAISLGKHTVGISSLEQLESDSVGYLVIAEYERTSSDNKKGFNLYDVFNIVNNQIDQENSRGKFYNKIFTLGIGVGDIMDTEHYINKYRFIPHNLRIYRVDDTFPRLKRSQILDNIVSIKYDLSIESLVDFEIDTQERFEDEYTRVY